MNRRPFRGRRNQNNDADQRDLFEIAREQYDANGPQGNRGARGGHNQGRGRRGNRQENGGPRGPQYQDRRGHGGNAPGGNRRDQDDHDGFGGAQPRGPQNQNRRGRGGNGPGGNRRNQGGDGRDAGGHPVIGEVNHDDRPPTRNGNDGREENAIGGLQRQAKQLYPMGFRKLEELETKSPAEVVFTVNSNRSGFKELLNENFLSNDKIGKCLQVISLGCQCEHKENRSQFLINLLKENEKFLTSHLIKYLLETQNSPPNAYRLVSMGHLLDLIETLQKFHPQESLMTTQILLPLAGDTIKRLTNVLGEQRRYLERLETLDAVKNSLVDNFSVVHATKKLPEDEVPNYFRDIPIFPDKHDLITNARPFLRANIVEGRYKNVEHYLDVQFRLLREDFIRPLREGIAMYLEQIKNNKTKQRLQDIKVYENVKISQIILTDDGVVHSVKFEVANGRRVQWEKSKRLLYGSLVCLTFDNFETIYFGTVSERDVEKLKNGQLGIKFEKQDEIMNVQAESFTMVETEAYFEASRHVLTALQDIEEDSFPLKEYIVELQKKMDRPDYLNDDTVYCLRTLVQLEPIEGLCRMASMNVRLKIGLRDLTCPCKMSTRQVPIILCDDSAWLTAKDFNLDPSQYKALKSALRQKLSIIQGPPGTGKTFVGLKIMEALLHNQKAWNELEGEERNPILIVCYTNHALDQFLEGVLKLTDKIVRMGGRSGSDALKPFAMNHLKRVYSRSMPGGNQMGRHFRDMKRELERMLHDIKSKEHTLKSINKDIQSEVALRDVMHDIHYQSFLNDAPKNLRLSSKHLGSIMQYWLGLQIPEHVWNVPNENALIVPDYREIEVEDLNVSDAEEAVEEELDLDAGEYEEVPPPPPVQLPREAAAAANGQAQLPNDEDEELSDEEDVEYLMAQRQEDRVENRNRVVVDVNDSDSDDGTANQVPQPRNGANAGQWQTQGGNKSRQKYLMSKMKSSQVLTEDEILKRRNVWSLEMDEKWRLYKTWINLYTTSIVTDVDDLKREYERKLATIGEAKTEEEIIVAKAALVIGMTTTGAAKYRHLVRNIRSKIVIVEEAAEVLEAQIVTSLSKYTKHLVLIGDHQQLRPNPVVYDLAKKYNLEISLFERLINNGVPFVRLGIQHRMKPDISRLLVPHIYSDLEDHESVFKYEEIMGFNKSVFFVKHSHNEQQETDSTSRVNNHEAQFLVSLVRYILQQGYEPTKITILTTYLGQLFTIKRLLTGSLREVRATVVDNFQGEENDIILLSFVRSNEDGYIGFLKTENRVCVALSRAKKGLFCIGNFDLFAQKSPLWSNITKTLETTKAIGPRLQLKCQNHGNVVEVASSFDFSQVPDGGCTEPCDFRLPCGHVCEKKCHPLNKEHQDVKCPKPCERVNCPLKHRCPKKCHEPCGDCVVRVMKTVPKCGHEVFLPCHVDEKSHKCTLPCRKLLTCGHGCPRTCGERCGDCRKLVTVTGPCGHDIRIQCLFSKDNAELSDACNGNCPKVLSCGHKCDKKCGKPCQTNCVVKVNVQLDCGHVVKSSCYKSKDRVNLQENCAAKCNAKLNCEHTCSGSCGECFQGRLHAPCNMPCKKILVCGHACQAPCSNSCPPCGYRCDNRCPHSRCQQTCGYPCPPCLEKCKWSCKHEKCLAKCGEICNRPPCKFTCTRKLKCGHICVGMCGEPCPKLCRTCNKEELETIFFGDEDHPKARFIQLEDCKHVIEIYGLTKWIQAQNEKTSEVKILSCPKCKTPIRRNLRFGNEVKAALARIETVKRKAFGELDKNKRDQAILETDVSHFDHDLKTRSKNRVVFPTPLHQQKSVKYKDCLKYLMAILADYTLDQDSLIIFRNYLSILKEVEKVENSLDDSVLNASNSDLKSLYQKALDFTSYTIERMTQKMRRSGRQTNQLIQDLSNETRRLQSLHNFLKDFGKIRVNGSLRAKEFFDVILKKLLVNKAMTEADFKELNIMKQKLVVLSEGAVIGITQDEKVQILKAMGLSQGHWYTCPNGHVYCITECGGAMVEGRCNECNAPIGGGSHRLRADNRVATAMDGARHSAWSTQADLANYRLEDEAEFI